MKTGYASLILSTLAMIVFLMCSPQLYADDFEVMQLTDNDVTDSMPQVFKSKVVWQGKAEDDSCDGDWEIFLDDGDEVIQITENDRDDINPQISRTRVVWQGKDENGYWQIFFYNGTEIKQLTNGPSDNINPRVAGHKIVWQGKDPLGATDTWEIYYAKGMEITQITKNNFDDVNPQLSRRMIAWTGKENCEAEIYAAEIPRAPREDMNIKITPRTLNLCSNGRWIQCMVKLPQGVNAADVDLDSFLLEEEIAPERIKITGGKKIQLKFNGSDFQDLLEPDDAVDIILTVSMKDGTELEATDIIRVIEKCKKKK